jgi:hypothetical protein
MKLAYPAYLWSLLGLVVPIAIHLLSRKEGKVIQLGSIRHVQETSTQQFKGIRLNEVWLLILRCTLIILFSLMLSGLYFDQKKGKWIVVENGTEKNSQVREMMDSLEKQGYQSHWLADHFPSITSSPDTTAHNYGALLRQLENQHLEEAVIFSFIKADQFKGRQPVVPSYIKIIPVETKENEFLLEATQGRDSVEMRMGKSNSSSTSFYTRSVKQAPDTIPVKQPRAIRIALVSDAAHVREKKMLKAAIRAIDRAMSSSFILEERDPANSIGTDSVDWYFWMANEKPPETKASVLQWNPSLSDQLIEQTGAKEWKLTQPLNEEIMLKKEFLVTLASLLTADPALQHKAAQHDQRVLPESMLTASSEEKETTARAGLPELPSFLFLMLVLLLGVERYLSYRKNQ